MKHTIKIVILLLSMFFLTQIIGLAVLQAYAPEIKQVRDAEGNIFNKTIYNLPYGTEPPQDTDPKINFISIIIALLIAVTLMFFLMRFHAKHIIRAWFFIIVGLAVGITLTAALGSLPYSSFIALGIALPLSFFKIYKRNIVVHNLTELMIYPGIAAIFVPLLNIWTVVSLLIFISLYDMYAVWHSGFMQKMAKYQIHHLKIFSGFFIPYIGKKERAMIDKLKGKKTKKAKIKVNVAILGGGDVVFPIILAGVVLRHLGLFEAFLITIGATLALAGLFYFSEKGKFYPAMPFISAGCFITLIIAYIL